MGLLQEKFQTVAPPASKGSGEWVDASTARRSKSAPEYLNCLPPGDNIGDQQTVDVRSMPRVMAGEGDVTPLVSEHFAKGYRRHDVQPTDDAYTAEHADTFYGEAKSGSDVGFVERGNVLDRI